MIVFVEWLILLPEDILFDLEKICCYIIFFSQTEGNKSGRILLAWESEPPSLEPLQLGESWLPPGAPARPPT